MLGELGRVADVAFHQRQVRIFLGHLVVAVPHHVVNDDGIAGGEQLWRQHMADIASTARDQNLFHRHPP